MVLVVIASLFDVAVDVSVVAGSVIITSKVVTTGSTEVIFVVIVEVGVRLVVIVEAVVISSHVFSIEISSI